VSRRPLKQLNRCPYFPQSNATEQCGRCRGFYSDQAIAKHDGNLLCPKCINETQAAERIRQEKRLTVSNIYKKITSADYRAGSIVLLVVFTFIGGYIYLASSYFGDATVDFEIIRRARVGFTQNFNLGDQGFDFAESINGGTVRVNEPSSPYPHTPARLIDGLPDYQVPSWRSAANKLPMSIIFDTNAERVLDKIVIWNHPEEDSNTYIKSFEIYTAASTESEMALLGAFENPSDPTEHVFQLSTLRPVRRVKMVILSTQGDGKYVSAAEIGLFLPRDERNRPPVVDTGRAR